MTILTKPSSKKAEKTILPLVGGGVPSAPNDPGHPGDDSPVSNIILVRNARRVNSVTTVLLFMIALLVTSLGIIGGVMYYRQYAHARNHLRFHGYCPIPYDAENMDDSKLYYMNAMLRDNGNQPEPSSVGRISWSDLMKSLRKMDAKDDGDDADPANSNFFPEEFEIGVSDEENYSKIDVPVFRGQRPGRFLHDFNFNQSGIIDKDGGRCFVMPLDHETVLPPKSLRDLIEKMWKGYYNINTSVLKKNMRVVTPELTDFSDVSPRVAKECEGMKIYRLEKIVTGVYKRSADVQERAKFAEFSGNHISIIDIQNLDELN